MNHDMKGELECILTRDCVSFIKKVESQDQLFQMMTDKMLEAGCVKEKFTMKESVTEKKKYPTGLLVNQTGFAIPHTDSERVNKSQICFFNH